MAIIRCPNCLATIPEHVGFCPCCGYCISKNNVIKKNSDNISIKPLSIVALAFSATVVLSPVGLVLGIIAILRAISLKKKNNISKIKNINGFIIAFIAIILAVVLILSSVLGFFLWYANHGHQYSEWQTVKASSCTETGLQQRECTICHYIETKETEMLPHDWEPATCTEPKKCKVCGLSSGNALGHTWKPATCTEPKKCPSCGITDGSPLGHDISDYECKRCGETFIEKDDIPDIIDISNPKYHVNTVGGIDVYFTITNKYNKTLKYATIEVEFFNAVGDVLSNQIGLGTSKNLLFTGPLEQWQTKADTLWEACFYNTTFDGTMGIKSVTLEYMDGKEITIDEDLANYTVVEWR